MAPPSSSPADNQAAQAIPQVIVPVLHANESIEEGYRRGMLEQVATSITQMREEAVVERQEMRQVLTHELEKIHERLNKTATKDDLMQYVRVDVFESHRAHAGALSLDNSARSLRLETKVESIVDKLHAAEITAAQRGDDRQERNDSRTVMLMWMGFSLLVSVVVAPLVSLLITALLHH